MTGNRPSHLYCIRSVSEEAEGYPVLPRDVVTIGNTSSMILKIVLNPACFALLNDHLNNFTLTSLYVPYQGLLCNGYGNKMLPVHRSDDNCTGSFPDLPVFPEVRLVCS